MCQDQNSSRVAGQAWTGMAVASLTVLRFLPGLRRSFVSLEPSPPTELRLHPRALRKPYAAGVVTCAGHRWATLVGDARSGPISRGGSRVEKVLVANRGEIAV